MGIYAFLFPHGYFAPFQCCFFSLWNLTCIVKCIFQDEYAQKISEKSNIPDMADLRRKLVLLYKNWQLESLNWLKNMMFLKKHYRP